MAKVEHDRENCIGCGACNAIYPEGWEMKEDGKSSIIGGKKREDGWEEKEITNEEEIAKHKEAAEACPVNVIHITINGERII